jgi:hypothetical protein
MFFNFIEQKFGNAKIKACPATLSVFFGKISKPIATSAETTTKSALIKSFSFVFD